MTSARVIGRDTMPERNNLDVDELLAAYLSASDKPDEAKQLSRLIEGIRLVIDSCLQRRFYQDERDDFDDLTQIVMAAISEHILSMRDNPNRNRIGSLKAYVRTVALRELGNHLARMQPGWAAASSRLEELYRRGLLAGTDITMRNGKKILIRPTRDVGLGGAESGERLSRVLDDPQIFVREELLGDDPSGMPNSLHAAVIVRLIEWIGQPMLWADLIKVYRVLFKTDPIHMTSWNDESAREFASEAPDPCAVVVGAFDDAEVWRRICTLQINHRRAYVLHEKLGALSVVDWLKIKAGIPLEDIAAAIGLTVDQLTSLDPPLGHKEIAEVFHDREGNSITWFQRAKALLRKPYSPARKTRSGGNKQ